jgi:hypothetical protein
MTLSLRNSIASRIALQISMNRRHESMANAPRQGVLLCPVMANTNGTTFYLMEQARSMIDFEVL